MAGIPIAAEGVVGVHVRDCRLHTYNKRARPLFTKSPLCACDANATWAFGADTCPDAIATVCGGVAGAASFPALCDACARGLDVDTTRCRRAVDRAAATVSHARLCGEVAPHDCRSESYTDDAPEMYVWWPTRNLLTPDRLAIAPLGSRAANPGDGIRIVS